MRRALDVGQALVVSAVAGLATAAIAYGVLPRCQSQYACAPGSVFGAAFVGMLAFAAAASVLVTRALDRRPFPAPDTDGGVPCADAEARSPAQGAEHAGERCGSRADPAERA